MRATNRAGELAALEEELILADLGSVEARLAKQRRAAKGDASPAAEVGAVERAEGTLSDGVPVYRSTLTADDRTQLEPVFLLTNKPALVVVNVDVDQLDDAADLAAPFGDDPLAVCVELEGDPDVVAVDGDERAPPPRRSRGERERRAAARPPGARPARPPDVPDHR